MMLEKHTYDLRKRSVVGLDRPRNMLLTDEICTEEHKSVGGTWNVALGAAFARRAALARRRGGGGGRGEKGRGRRVRI
jgi:hypothetical protein